MRSTMRSTMRSVVILGGGIIGLLLAREFRLRGVAVHLLEARGVGQGCSRASTGILKPPEHQRTPFFQLRQGGWEAWPHLARQLREETGIDPGYRCCGGIDLRAGTIRNPGRARERLLDSGGQVEILDGRQIGELLPGLDWTPAAGLLVEREAQLDPLSTLKALKSSCLAAGVVIEDQLGEIRVEPVAEQQITLRSSSGRSLPTISADQKVIVAAGWESVAATVAMEGVSLPLDPVCGEAISLDIPAPRHMVHLDGAPDGLKDPSGNRFKYSWIAAPDGSSWLGNSVTETTPGGEFTTRGDAGVTAAGREELLTVARKLFGAAVEERVVEHWAGFRPKAMRHGGPLLGQWPGMDRLWIATGHYRTGFLVGPSSARLLADAILEGEPIPETFSIPR